MPPDVEKPNSDSDLDSIYSFSNCPILSSKKCVNSSKQKYNCSFENCKESFVRSTLLDRHEFKHTGVKKHVCFFENCSKSYIISTHLKRHIQTYHEKISKLKTIKCLLDTCNKFFDSPYNMERHMREVHENCKIYSCNLCSKEFNRKIQLRRHEVTHTGNYPYNCTVCSKGFVQKIHFDRHTCNINRCEDCEKTFSKWSQLVAHRKTDHPRNYSCEICKKSFKHKDSLRNHKQMHKEKSEREVYACQIDGCHRYYYCAKNLKAHVKMKHDGGNKFKCPIDGCEKLLSTKQKLNEHVHKIHNFVERIKNNAIENKPKKMRSDCGKKKISMATKLSCIPATAEVEKLLLANKGSEIKLDDETKIKFMDCENMTLPVLLDI